jgi:hypothetical protein
MPASKNLYEGERAMEKASHPVGFIYEASSARTEAV